jgi:hypothetical protein
VAELLLAGRGGEGERRSHVSSFASRGWWFVPPVLEVGGSATGLSLFVPSWWWRKGSKGALCRSTWRAV